MLEDLIDKVHAEREKYEKMSQVQHTMPLALQLAKINHAQKDLADYVLVHARELISAERQAMPLSFLDDDAN